MRLANEVIEIRTILNGQPRWRKSFN